MQKERTSEARAELRAWYVHHLQPKLARAVSEGAVEPQVAAVFGAEVRRLLDLPCEREPR